MLWPGQGLGSRLRRRLEQLQGNSAHDCFGQLLLNRMTGATAPSSLAEPKNFPEELGLSENGNELSSQDLNRILEREPLSDFQVRPSPSVWRATGLLVRCTIVQGLCFTKYNIVLTSGFRL